MKKIIRITEDDLKEVIKRAFNSVVENIGQFRQTETINVGELRTITNEEEFTKWANIVWEQLQLSYSNVGGLKSYRNFNDFCRKGHILEVVVNGNELLACATYRRIEDSLKMVAIGCNQTPNGKLALQQIVQNTIRNAHLLYWAEVSGAIEYYFKKHNGYAMPNDLAAEILQVDESQIELSTTDKVHYDRPIGPRGEIYTKMIFGIKDVSIYHKALKEVGNYSKFLEDVNKINESIKQYSLKQAIYIIENIYRAHEEDGFNELVPSWYEALTSSLETLRSVENNTQTIVDYIGYGEYLLEDMQLLELHEF